MKARILLCWLVLLCGISPDASACLRVWRASDGGSEHAVLSTNYAFLDSAYIDKENNYPQMNVRPIPRDEWIAVDADYDAQVFARRLYFRERPKVVLQTRGAHKRESEAAGRELLKMLAHHLPSVYPDRFLRRGDTLYATVNGKREAWNFREPAEPALAVAGQLVQEDLLLLRADARGVYKLETGFVAVPSSWLLADMLGKSVDEIHAEVPGYSETLGPRVNRFIGHLRPDLTFARNNFFVYDTPFLRVRGDVSYTYEGPEITLANVGNELYFRSEYETFARLPESGYVLFTIKPHVYPMRTLVERPEVGRRFQQMLNMPGDEYPYHRILVEYFRKNLR